MADRLSAAEKVEMTKFLGSFTRNPRGFVLAAYEWGIGELENKYPSVLSYMKSVDNSAQGAYDAGYYWCYYFEIPGNRASNSVKRGNIAQNDFWPEYQ